MPGRDLQSLRKVVLVCTPGKGGPETGSIGAMGAFDKGGEGLAFHSAIRWGKVVAVVCA